MRPLADVPKWSALLVEALNKPGLIMQAYSAFHPYSIGNQILALVQYQVRGLEPGPINTFPGWQALGRNVKRGERALVLCMPIMRKVRNQQTPESDSEDSERTFTSFVHKARWFAVSQTVGDDFTPTSLPDWDSERANMSIPHSITWSQRAKSAGGSNILSSTSTATILSQLVPTQIVPGANAN